MRKDYKKPTPKPKPNKAPVKKPAAAAAAAASKPAKAQGSFGSAFRKAHDSGADTFMWNGKKYTTKMKDGTTSNKRKAALSKKKT